VSLCYKLDVHISLLRTHVCTYDVNMQPPTHVCTSSGIDCTHVCFSIQSTSIYNVTIYSITSLTHIAICLYAIIQFIYIAIHLGICIPTRCTLNPMNIGCSYPGGITIELSMDSCTYRPI